jgi:cobalt-precorrin 5A hydrolase
MNCAVENADLIKEVSGTLLGGGIVPVSSDFEISGEVPSGVELSSYAESSVCVTIRDEVCMVSCEDACADCRTDGLSAPIDKNSARKLRIIPRVVCVGIGCRRGTPAEEIEDAVLEALRENVISPKALAALASIDLKAEEEGIKELARKYKLPFLVYSAEELGEVPGEFTGSEFVMSVTGVDNVCERAAVRAALSSALFCGAGNRFVTGSECGIAGESDCGAAIGYAAELICRKRVRGGVTVALARRKADLNWEVRFQ